MDQVKIVESVNSTDATILDLNDGTTWLTTYEGTDLTPPPLRRQVTQNLMADGGFVTAAAYDLRTIRLGLEVKSSTADTAATAVQTLARALERPGRKFLKWQPDGQTHAVWFPLHRSDFTGIREIPSASSKFRRFEVPLLADPHGVGLPETATVTVNFNPAAGSNGHFIDITGVKGDVETPLHLTSADVDLENQTMMIATRRRGTPSNVTWFRQAESLSLGTDTTLPGADATASGSGSNYARTSFATNAAQVARVTGTFPNTTSGSVDWRGTYRLLVRARKNTAGDVVTMRMDPFEAPPGATTTITTSSTAWLLHDLGLLQIPSNNPGRYDGWNAEPPTTGTAISIEVGRTSGAGSFDIDYVALVPADDDLAVFVIPSYTETLVLDGPNTAAYTRASGALDSTSVAVRYEGRMPRLDPNAGTNRVFIWPGFETFINPTLITDTASITWTYWPLYRYVRGAST